VAEVQLVDARDRFVHNVGAIRGVVDPSLLDRILIPYDRLLRRGSVRQSIVTGASSNGVTLTDGEHIEGDIVVVATGSHYASPFKPQGESTQAFADGIRTAHSNLKSANAIAIVGGGAVGTELAGEISSAYSGKAVTLVSGSPSLMPGYSDKLAGTLAAQLRSKGVLLRFNRRVENLPAMALFWATWTKTSVKRVNDLSFQHSVRGRPQPFSNGCRAQLSMRNGASRSMRGCGRPAFATCSR
jgi:NADH dehydrogenase FAD-containing subunit